VSNISPNFDEFSKLQNEFNIVPIYKEIQGDMFTAISIFQKIRTKSFQFLLESAVSGESFGRYSIMGYSDRAISCKNGNIVEYNGMEKKQILGFDNPFDYIKDIFNSNIAFSNPNLPPFVNGLVGSIGYDSIQYFENIKLPEKDELLLNDFDFIYVDRAIIYDNLQHKIYLVASPKIDKDKTVEELYEKSVNIIDELLLKINDKEQRTEPFIVKHENGKIAYKSNFTKEKYENSVNKAKDYIYKGDIFQLVLSQRLRIPVEGDSFNLYRALRVINPSPYMFYLKINDVEVIGSSPEIHVKLENEKVGVRPIAGTRPRGKSSLEDKENEIDLLNDEKEIAEHIMLVDLGRNDLGRVCQGGSVLVEDFKNVEYYSHVMHIVSHVTGKLCTRYNQFDLIKATFPAGTVSGAPKIRAMDIIGELEPERRGIYSGMIGYFTYDKNFDSCIAIRTMIVKNGNLYLQAGAGIVSDSIPEKEYFETIHKMKALTKAVELAGEYK